MSNFRKKRFLKAILRQKVGAKNGFSRVFLSTQKSKNMIKKWDINRRKLKKRGTPKMVSKHLKGHYFRSYEQFR